MQTRRNWKDRCYRGTATLALAGAATVLIATMPSAVARPAGARDAASLADLHKIANDRLGLSDSDLVSVAVDHEGPLAQSVNLPVDGELLTLDLQPHSVRATNYQVFIAENGTLVPTEPQPISTVRGTVRGVEGATVAGSVTEDGLTAMIRFDDGTRLMVEPAAPEAPGLAADAHIVYRDEDINPHGGTCAWSEEWQLANGGVFEDTGGVAGGGGVAGTGGGIFDCAELAIDTDHQYYADYGSAGAVENQVNLVINTMNTQYETQVNITHLITAIVIRPTAGVDPYSATSSAGALLDEMSPIWDSAPESAIQRDATQLFTGRSIAGGTIGIAWLGAICDTSGSFQAVSMVESDFNGNFTCATDLSAHELGHNWAAGHCSCTTTMAPSIQCANNFGPGAIASITSFRDSRTCLSECSGASTTLPFADGFPTSSIDTTLWGFINGPIINGSGDNPPSPSLSLNLEGGEEIRSARMDTTAVTFLTLSYWWQRTGNASSPENGDDLIVEFEDDSFNWVQVASYPGAGPDNDPFQFESILLPAAATHTDMRVRFRVAAGTASDDWFIDDVSIDGLFPPANNACATGQLVSDGDHVFTNVGATPDGPAESPCFTGTDDNDIWFIYFVACEGTLEVSLQGTDFDAKVAVYPDGACPGGADTAIACFSEPGQTSTNVPVVSGVHRIRVGGVGGASGTGTLSLSCTPGAGGCVEDCDSGGDGNVDVTDLLTVLAEWGQPGPHDCDVAPQPAPDGNVDVADLLAVLAIWGGICP